MPSPPMSYLFGDSPAAQQRLDVLARTFQSPTRKFLSNFKPSATTLAVDLGCGPGHTTRLIADLLPFERVVGLDKSTNFVSNASNSAAPRLSFLNHDVTCAPFPLPPADLIFCRFLLPHLPTPERALALWACQLSHSGSLLLEEVHWIHTRNPIFDSYLSALARVLEAQGTALYAGSRLPDLLDGAPFRVVSDQTHRHPVSNVDAATMFSMNIRSWGATHPATALYGSTFLRTLHSDLREIAGDFSAADSEIEWGMRQMVLEPV